MSETVAEQEIQNDSEIIEEATCAKEGLKIQRCQDCGFEVETKYLSDIVAKAINNVGSRK